MSELRDAGEHPFGAPAAEDVGGDLWAIVLAGGSGIRLQPLVKLVHGDARPKQYARLVGGRSLFRRTLDRVALRIPAARTVVVSMDGQADYLALEEEERRGPLPPTLRQPADRGTAAAVLLAAQWISWRDPEAMVALFPSDHFVLGESLFMTYVLQVTEFARRHRERLVLVGARPDGPETQYGWIEPGDPLDAPAPARVRCVRRFLEKPAVDVAKTCRARGWLWNTFVMVSTVTALVETGWRALPEMSDALACVEPFVNSGREEEALATAYAGMAGADFAYAVLAAEISSLAVTALPRGVVWSDWGTPARVIESLSAAGLTPSWLRALGRGDAARGTRR